MGVRANWHHDELEKPDEDDPFVDYDGTEGRSTPGSKPPQRLTDRALWQRRGETIHPAPVGYWVEYRYTMQTPLNVLKERLAELEQREQNCTDMEVTCPIKGKPGMACSACPISEAGQSTIKAMLCRLGREQERLRGLIHAKEQSA